MIGFHVFAFLLAAFVTWLNIAIFEAIAGIWLDSDKARIAAFAFTLGVIVSFDELYSDDHGIAVFLGMNVAFFALWWIHFVRGRDRDSGCG